jgi:hypothetical protein
MVHKTRKLRPYAILTTDSNRVEIKAWNLEDAFRKAKKELIKFNADPNLAKVGFKPQDLTPAYETYGRSGISTRGFVTTAKSVKLAEKHNLGISKKSPLEVLYGKVEYGS